MPEPISGLCVNCKIDYPEKRPTASWFLFTNRLTNEQRLLCSRCWDQADDKGINPLVSWF